MINIGEIEEIDFANQMQKSYIDYAMEVIIGRALPDVRDGLKPVHRRILHSMNELCVYPEGKYRKSARIVGDVLGKYHPHSDTSVYDAMVILAQDFSTRYPLVDGHGNFGSVDGDSSASIRYTEAKMSKFTMEILKDINKDTVDFISNFDESEKEPTVLPSRFPNLLVNGSSGIAVGMATNMPPHNLGEVIDGIIYQIDNPDCSIKDLMKYIKSPDFPTGARIVFNEEVEKSYMTGRGKITILSKYHFENNKIIFTEIPYKVNKAKLIENIKKLIKEKKIVGISNILDESDRKGMRIVVECKKDMDREVVVHQLFKKNTKLKDTFGVINLAIVDGVPKLLNLKEMIYYYLEHQKEVLTRSSKYDLNKVNNRIHILEGIIRALDNIDKTIHIIKNSNNTSQARENLISELNISQTQAQTILDMRLQRLTGLEKEKIDNELNELKVNKGKLETLLSDENELLKELKNKLLELKEKYNDERRTEIVSKDTIQEIDEEDLIEDYNCKVFLTKDGYFKKVKLTSIKGNQIHKLKEDDYVTHEQETTNKSVALIFTSIGNCHKLYLQDIEDTKISNIGTFLYTYLNLQEDEKIVGMVTTTDYSENVYIGYKNGQIACIKAKSYQTKQKRSKLENSLNLNSEVVNIFKLDKPTDIVCISNIDKVLIVDSSKFNPKGAKNSQGNKCLTSKNDSYMVKCYPLIDKVEGFDYGYYKINGSSGTGKYLRKGDEF